MRKALFPILLVTVVAIGFVALLSHRPGTAPIIINEPPPALQPPAAQQPPAVPPTATARSAPEPAATATPSAPAAPASPAATPRAASPSAIAAPQQPAVPAMRHASATPDVGDPAAGQKVFRKCQACHSLEAGKNLVGPSLAGIMGRKSGTAPGFAYSPAMQHADITWTPQTLAAYLADPQQRVPGNRMPFPGLKSEQDRDDVIAFLEKTSAAAPGTAAVTAVGAPAGQPSTPASSRPPAQAAPAATHGMPDMPDVKYTLRTGIAEGRMVFLGVGGAIDGKVNPVLTAASGQMVQVTLINGEGAEDDIVFPDQRAQSARVTGKGASTTIAFRAEKDGDFTYYCSLPGHRLAGMEGKLLVTPRPPAETVAYADISRDPTDLPPPLTRREPQTVRVDLVTTEVEGRLAEGTTFGYWTFNSKVPGPFVRVRVGDRVEVHLKNSADSTMVHSVDFHAATGPGGGAAAMQVNPADEKTMTFKALVPGLYVYHCATPMVAEHIANGMYGLILVEPEEGLPKVDREFYLMQGEIYTDAAYGQHGSQEFSVEKLLAERPEYFVFNGAVGALSSLHPLRADVGQTIRIFFGVGGPNFVSSFHVIGEIFDRAYDFGGVLTTPQRGIQTITVPPGGAAIAEFKPLVPGNYAIVDHALARVERGLAGTLVVEGSPNPEIYSPMPRGAAMSEPGEAPSTQPAH